MDQKGDFSPVYSIFKTFGRALTKTASSKVFSVLCSKLGMIDIYAPA